MYRLSWGIFETGVEIEEGVSDRRGETFQFFLILTVGSLTTRRLHTLNFYNYYSCLLMLMGEIDLTVHKRSGGCFRVTVESPYHKTNPDIE